VPQAAMALKFTFPPQQPMPNEQEFGFVKYTYYVKFRGQTLKD